MTMINDVAAALASMNAASLGLGNYNGAVLSAIANVGSVYSTRINSMAVNVYVNQALGVDTNPGTSEAPVRTLNRALAMTPPGGLCNCFMQANYNVDVDVVVNNRILTLNSDSGVKYNLTFERYAANLSTVFRGARAFFVGPSGHLNIRGLTVVVPPLDGNWTTLTPFNIGLVNWHDSNQWGAVRVCVTECNWQIPASPFCSLFANSGIYVLQFFGNTLNGAITTMNGNVVSGVTNPAGTAASGLPYILTNLTTI